jgi:CubicO group peptidase (beta-lactamase class C family)
MDVKKSLPRLFIFLLIICFSCKDNTVEPSKPSWTLEDAFSIAGQDANLRCLIVYKDNQIIKERYFHLGDSSSTLDVRSVTKSVMATLIGIAIDKDSIPSEDQMIGNYLRPLVGTIDSSKANIKIRDVLSMTSGLSGNDLVDGSGYTNWENAQNQLNYILSRPMVNVPGQVFAYNNGAAHLTSAVLTQASKMSTLQFAKQYFLQLLGIPDRSWLKDKQGIYNGAEGLYLTPYDMLKIGQLYLGNGVFNGVRVVSEDWIKKATTVKVATDVNKTFAPGYGYFWWLGMKDSHAFYFANGFGGQFIVVVPDLNLIIVATNNWANVAMETANQQWTSTLDVIINKIIPLYE